MLYSISYRQESLVDKGRTLEEAINALQTEITDYVVLASQKQLSEEESNHAYIILQSLNDIERIGDHCENIIEQGTVATQERVSFSGEAQQELEKIIEVTNNILLLAFWALERQDTSVAENVLNHEEMIDELQETYRRNHIRRLNEGICNGSNGAVFLDILNNLERIGDHCRNIGEYVLGEK